MVSELNFNCAVLLVAVGPSAPGNPVVSGTPTTTSIALTWTPSATAGIPAETYTLFCMLNSTATCNIAQKVGTSAAVDVPRNTTSGNVTGLTAGTAYKCCVLAKNTVNSTYSLVPPSTTTLCKYLILIFII